MKLIGKKWLYQWVLITIGIIAYLVVINKLINFNGWNDFGNLIQNNSLIFIGILIFQIFLSTINILSEAFKWHLLITCHCRQTFFLSLKQVLSGYSVGTFTPARLGEPIGRLIDLPKQFHLTAIGLSYLGGFIQTMVITAIGAISLSYSAELIYAKFSSYLKIEIFSNKLWIIIVTLFILLAVLKFIFPLEIRNWIRLLKKNLLKISYKKWGQFLGFTVIRYFIYSTQVIIWLSFFNQFINLKELIVLTPFYFLVITIIPSFYLTELGVRGSMAVIIFGSTILNSPGIVTAVFLTWLINIGVPTTVGASIQIANRRKTKSL